MPIQYKWWYKLSCEEAREKSWWSVEQQKHVKGYKLACYGVVYVTYTNAYLFYYLFVI